MKKLLLAFCLTLSAHAQVSGILTGVISAGALPPGTVATPTASPTAGSYSSTQTVTLSDSTSGAAICYRLDGGTPTAAMAGTCDGSPTLTYSTSLSISSTTTVKAIGTKASMTNSAMLTALYTISGPPAFVISSCQETTANGGTTSGVNTTGANFFVAWIPNYSGGGLPTVVDNANTGATINSLTLYTAGGNPEGKIYYWTGTGTASHTISATGFSTYPTVCLSAFSGMTGTLSSGSDSGFGTVTSSTTCQPGSITPAAGFPLVVTGAATAGGPTISSVSSPYSPVDSSVTGTTTFASAIAHVFQGSPAATNPTWTYSGSSAALCAIAAFK